MKCLGRREETNISKKEKKRKKKLHRLCENFTAKDGETVPF